MKKKASLTKKVASVAAGTVLAASLYANAVYQPRNESALEQALDRELQAVVTGQAEVKAMGDGFVVVERETVASLSNQALPNEIVQLEAEMLANSHEAASALASAYDSGEVTAVAQANRRDRRSTSATPTQAQIAAVAQVVARISGVPVGQTIGTLASIASNPFVAAAIIEVAAATATPGGVAAVASNSGGLSLAAQTLISSAGTTAPTGIAEAVTQAATTSNGSTTTSGSSCTSC